MVFKYCLGMIMSVSTLMIFKGAATPSSVVNLSIDRASGWRVEDRWFIANKAANKGLILRVFRKSRYRFCEKNTRQKTRAILHQPRSRPYRRRITRNGGRF